VTGGAATYQANGGLNFAAAGAGSQTLLTSNANSASQDEKDASVETLANVATQAQPKTDNNTNAPATPKASPNQSVVLPNTGTEAEQLAFLGMTLGVAPSFSANALAVKLAIPSSLTNCKAVPMIASLLNLTLGGIRLLSRNSCCATLVA